MKQFFYTLLIFGLLYFVYWYITRTPDIVKVSGTLRVLNENSSDNNFNASVYGVAENVGDIPAKDVWIIYKIGDNEVTAYINELSPKEKENFRTGTSRTKVKDVEFKLVSVQYNNK